MQRISYQKAAPEALQSMLAFSAATRKTDLPEKLLSLVDFRVSQMNGCAFCLDMHSKDLRALGETEQRIYMVSAWREVAHLYTARERAALAWAEAITALAGQQVPDAVYEQARAEFSDKELAELTLAIVAINGWNRLNVAFHTPAGNYKSRFQKAAA